MTPSAKSYNNRKNMKTKKKEEKEHAQKIISKLNPSFKLHVCLQNPK